MRYLCLFYVDEKQLAALSSGELRALREEAERCSRELSKHGLLLAAELLEPAVVATTLRKRRGYVALSEGPVLERAEQLGGFILVDTPNLDKVIDIVSRLPVARIGCVEVRPVRESARGPTPAVH